MNSKKPTDKRRIYGEHLTSVEIFREFILPEIKKDIYKYRWVDLFCGEGNLVLPILELIPEKERIEFFKKHIFLFDIQQEMIDKAIINACKYGIPKEIAYNNIIQQDTIKHYPEIILKDNLPVYHITNPPYLYIGYIVKHQETQQYLEYFQGNNKGYQDLYQLALINDLRSHINKMIYIIPTNFLFGCSISNKIRDDFLMYYDIKKSVIFEKKIFEFTGVNVGIFFFERKETPAKGIIKFEGIKINQDIHTKAYTLHPHNHYRAGNEFEEFVQKYKAHKPLKVSFYLTMEDVKNHKGNITIEVIDANVITGKGYQKTTITVNDELYNKIKSNILFIRTIDTGEMNGRTGLYTIKEIFNVDGIIISKAKYRTHPIPIFFEPQINQETQILLKNYFNLMLEYFRQLTDSEFMTTYKYSDSKYTRKYLGLTQAKSLIETFPILTLSTSDVNKLKDFVENKEINKVISFVKEHNTA